MALGVAEDDREPPLARARTVMARDFLHVDLAFGDHRLLIDSLVAEDSPSNHLLVRCTATGTDLEANRRACLVYHCALEAVGLEPTDPGGSVAEAALCECGRREIGERLFAIGALARRAATLEWILTDDTSIATLADALVTATGEPH